MNEPITLTESELDYVSGGGDVTVVRGDANDESIVGVGQINNDHSDAHRSGRNVGVRYD